MGYIMWRTSDGAQPSNPQRWLGAQGPSSPHCGHNGKHIVSFIVVPPHRAVHSGHLQSGRRENQDWNGDGTHLFLTHGGSRWVKVGAAQRGQQRGLICPCRCAADRAAKIRAA